jgi:malic enzyme
MRLSTKLLLLSGILLCCLAGQCQDTTRLHGILFLPDKYFGALDKKSKSIEEKLDKQTAKYLSRMERQENKLRNRIIPMMQTEA